MKRIIFLSLLAANLFFIAPVFASLKTSVILAVPKEKSVPILVYHSIAPAPLAGHESGTQKHYRIDPAVFESELKYLKDNGYTTISFFKYSEHFASGMAIPDKSVVLTFDDGWQTQYDNALPILKKYGDTATFFIYTKVINPKHRTFMSWPEVLELDKAGMEVASHSISHPMLTKIIDIEKLRTEIAGSKKILEDKLGKKVNTFAYPFYMYNSKVSLEIKKAGYISARAGWKKMKNSKDEIYTLGAMEAINDLKNFAVILKQP